MDIQFHRTSTRPPAGMNDLPASALQDLLSSMPGCLLVTDADLTIIATNRASTYHLGYSHGQIIGKRVTEIVLNPPDYDVVMEYGAAIRCESDCKRADGSHMPSVITTGPVHDPEGNFWGLIHVAIDLSKEKGLEKELHESEREKKRLADLRSQLLEATRCAGMAEVATGILHNVGNVLNSAGVSLDVIIKSLEKSKIRNLGNLRRLLAAQSDVHSYLARDVRGRRVPEYFAKLAVQVENERDSLFEEAKALRKNLEHIKSIISTQQSFARHTGAVELVALNEIVESAVRLSEDAYAQVGVSVQLDIDTVEPAELDRHKILQILVNLLSNARDAVIDAQVSDPSIIVRLRRRGDGAVVEVQDNGVGLEPDVAKRIFEHGFTTKKSGHGFGLHASSLDAKNMGGSLSCASSGLGTGACFRLEVPLPRTEDTDDEYGQLQDSYRGRQSRDPRGLSKDSVPGSL